MDIQSRLDRRAFLCRALAGMGMVGFGPRLWAGDWGSPRPAMGSHAFVRTGLGKLGVGMRLGELGPPDANGIRLPPGYTARVVARAGERIGGYRWHSIPDGGCCFAAPDGGWIYASNCELTDGGRVGALRFDPNGNVVDAYSILEGTRRNCSGGPTPWGTWLSCEEVDDGRVYECDPMGQLPAQRLDCMGTFKHEAAAVDPVSGFVYLTEDQGDGRLYRLVTDRYPDLSSGVLEVAELLDDPETGPVPMRWHPVPNPNPDLDAGELPTRRQVAASTRFRAGEGIWHHQGLIYFTTKNDNRVWMVDAANDVAEIVYDASDFAEPVLTGVDNLVTDANGNVYVAEDGGDMQIVVLAADGTIQPLLQLVGHDDSELTGTAFNPSGERFYFASMRSSSGIDSRKGLIYEVTGPFQDFIFADGYEK